MRTARGGIVTPYGLCIERGKLNPLITHVTRLSPNDTARIHATDAPNPALDVPIATPIPIARRN